MALNFGSKPSALWRKLRRNRSGTSAVEFALVAPILVGMLVGIVEIGHLFLVQAEITATTREAVRRIAMDVMTEEETAAFIHDQLAEILSDSVPLDSGDVLYTKADAVSDTSLAPDSSSSDALAVNVVSTELASGRTDLTVFVSVPAGHAALLDLSDLFPSEMTLDASATMVKE